METEKINEFLSWIKNLYYITGMIAYMMASSKGAFEGVNVGMRFINFFLYTTLWLPLHIGGAVI